MLATTFAMALLGADGFRFTWGSIRFWSTFSSSGMEVWYATRVELFCERLGRMMKARMTPARVIESKAMTMLMVLAILCWRFSSASVSGDWMCRLIRVVSSLCPKTYESPVSLEEIFTKFPVGIEASCKQAPTLVSCACAEELLLGNHEDTSGCGWLPAGDCMS